MVRPIKSTQIEWMIRIFADDILVVIGDVEDGRVGNISEEDR